MSFVNTKRLVFVLILDPTFRNPGDPAILAVASPDFQARLSWCFGPSVAVQEKTHVTRMWPCKPLGVSYFNVQWIEVNDHEVHGIVPLEKICCHKLPWLFRQWSNHQWFLCIASLTYTNRTVFHFLLDLSGKTWPLHWLLCSCYTLRHALMTLMQFVEHILLHCDNDDESVTFQQKSVCNRQVLVVPPVWLQLMPRVFAPQPVCLHQFLSSLQTSSESCCRGGNI